MTIGICFFIYTLTTHVYYVMFSFCVWLVSVVNQVGFHRDQQCLASCSADKTLKLWDIRSHQLIQHYPAHTSSVTGMSMHPVCSVIAIYIYTIRMCTHLFIYLCALLYCAVLC